MQGLCLLEVSKLFDHLFLTETGKADGKFDVITASLSTQYEPFTVLFVSDVGTGDERGFGPSIFGLRFVRSDRPQFIEA